MPGRSLCPPCNAALHHGNHMLDSVLAVLLQPFIDDAHEPVQVKRHHVFLLGRQNMKPFQNRREHMMVQRMVCFVQAQDGCMLIRGAKHPPVLLDIVQIRCQVFRRDEVQFLQRTGLDLRDKPSCVIGHCPLIFFASSMISKAYFFLPISRIRL